MHNRIPQFKQTGSALIVALSILVVLTLLGVASMQGSSLQEKMAGNSRDAQVAFQAAEAAIRQGELYVFNIVGLDDFSPTGGIGGYYTARTGNAEAWTVEGNWATAQDVNYTMTSSSSVSRNPHYIVQVIESNMGLGDTPNLGSDYGQTFSLQSVGVFQITARGYGISPNTRVMLQSYYGRL